MQKKSIDNLIIKRYIQYFEHEINAGSSFAQALAGYDKLIGQEMISLIKVGQESGMLADMLVRIAGMYQQRLLRGLSRINTLFQPFLLIILGAYDHGIDSCTLYTNYEFELCSVKYDFALTS